MFPSSGYFRGVNCPYFASGLCDRAYCHFRHSKPQEEKPKETLQYSVKAGPSYSFNSSQISGYSASPYLQKNITGYLETNESPSQSSSHESLTSKNSYSTARDPLCPIPSFSETPTPLPESAPEPEIDRQSLPKISGLAKRKSSAPSYNPTPKNVTNDLETDSNTDSDVPSYHPTPKSLAGSVTGTSGKRSVIQYDPVKNYAVNPKQHSSTSDDEPEPGKGNTTSREVEFSADEEDVDNNQSANESHPNGECESHDDAHSKRPIPSYADFLTPSSYFTNKLSSLSSSSRANDPDSINKCQSFVDSDTSSVSRENGCSDKQSNNHSEGTNKQSGSKSPCCSSSSTSSTSSRSKDKSSHRGSGLSSKEHSGSKSKSHSDSSLSSSKSKSSSSSKSSSTSKSKSSSSLPHSSIHDSRHHSKYSSSKSRDKSSHSSKDCDSHSLSKKEKSSSHSDSASKISDSSRRHSRSSSSDSKHSGAKGNKCVSRDNDSNHPKNEKESGHKSHASISKHSQSSSVSHSSHSFKGSKSHLSSDNKSSHSVTLNEKSKKSNSDITKVKEERRSSLDTNNRHSKKSSQSQSERDRMKHCQNDSKNIKPCAKDKERRKSHDSKREIVRSEIKEEKKSTKGRHFSDIKSDLFGEASDGSDSDVQIVEPPPQSPPVVLELTDSDEEDHSVAGMLSEDDFIFSDSDTFDECLRIFQETDRKLKLQKRSAISFEDQESNSKSDLDDGYVVPGKKRMAHPSAQKVVRPFKATGSIRPRLSPAEVMHNRIVEMQKRALLRAARREGREADLPGRLKADSPAGNGGVETNNNHPPTVGGAGSKSLGRAAMSTSASSLLMNQKKREAHLPSTPTKTITSANSASSVWSPNSFYTKNKQQQGSSSTSKGTLGTSTPSKMITIASTASKTEKRKAHVPTAVNLKRPLIAAGDSSKVPINVRQRYLNLIIDEFLKFCQEETAFQKGQEEEQEVYKRATNKNIYLRVAVNAIKRIRTEAAQSQPSSSKKARLDLSDMASRGSSAARQSHAATLGGSRAAKVSYTLNRSGPHRVQTEFKGIELYKRLKKYIMTEEQLKENTYPRPSEDGKNKAVYYGTKVQDSLSRGNERLCRRCGKRYYVEEDGTPVTQQECIYHYANLYKKKVAGSLDSRYGCCSERAGVKGCQVAYTHVNEVNKYENLSGYMKTLPASESDPKNIKVLSLDCEMVYTKAGMELARVTVIGDENQVVYETFVKPDTDIIDYNTRFSGITAKDMKGVETTLRGVQAVMLSMISDKTILIGHSLESDLTALKMIHNTVVDTSIVFPHRLGLPYKRALRNLMVDHLQKIIQTDDGGHDSKEDAISCMQLMVYKVKQDAKGEIRRF